jgi:hypothetical protein
MKKLLTSRDLEKRCLVLGIDTKGNLPNTGQRGENKATDAELQRRLIEAERANRESKLWLFAIVSALASVLSAVAAFVAVFQVNIEKIRDSFTRHHHALVPCLTSRSSGHIALPNLLCALSASHKSFVRAIRRLPQS